MTIERAAISVAWMAGVLLGLGMANENGFLMAAGGILMLIVGFGLSPMFHDVKEKNDDQ